jgi:hypothetical protein
VTRHLARVASSVLAIPSLKRRGPRRDFGCHDWPVDYNRQAGDQRRRDADAGHTCRTLARRPAVGMLNRVGPAHTSARNRRSQKGT